MVRRALLAALVACLGCEGGPVDRGDAISDDASVADATVDVIIDAIADDMSDDAIAPGEIRYRLAWDHTGLEPAPGGGWAVDTARGYRVVIERGYVTSHQISLVPCTPPADGGARLSPGRLLWALVGGVAHAGHDGEEDPSYVERSQVESVTALQDIAFGAVAVPSALYCKGHHVIGHADDDTIDVPAVYDGERLTLHFEGTWQRGNGAPTAFTVRTTLAAGRALDLIPAGGGEAQRLDPGDGGFTVTVHRRPAGWFDRVDFIDDDPDGRARALLLGYVDALSLTVER